MYSKTLIRDSFISHETLLTFLWYLPRPYRFNTFIFYKNALISSAERNGQVMKHFIGSRKQLDKVISHCRACCRTYNPTAYNGTWKDTIRSGYALLFPPAQKFIWKKTQNQFIQSLAKIHSAVSLETCHSCKDLCKTEVFTF